MARTKTAVSLDTKRRIADAALEQFHLKGYNGTSVQDLMSAVGAPKGTFYNHFASKEALAVDALRRYGDGFGLAALADAGSGTPRERIDRHLAGLMASGLTIAAEVPAHSATVASAIGDFLELWTATLTTAIDEAKAAGELTTDIPSGDLAEFIVNAWEGGAVKSKATSSNEPVRTFERRVAVLLR